jgi:hypothetical protein
VDTDDNDDLYERDIEPSPHYNLRQSATETIQRIFNYVGPYETARRNRLKLEALGLTPKSETPRRRLRNAVDLMELPNGAKCKFAGNGDTGNLVFAEPVNVALREWENFVRAMGMARVCGFLIRLAELPTINPNFPIKRRLQWRTLEDVSILTMICMFSGLKLVVPT